MQMLSELNGWVNAQFAAATGASAFFLLFLGGLLASLLPCVYPLYPITANILRSRESRHGAWAHPTSYYLGLAGIYFALGLFAALGGGAFNELLRLPAVNLGIGALLFVLALSTVGFLDFPILSARPNQTQNLWGTLLMGAGAGLLSSACVGPIVVSVLIGVATASGGATLASSLDAALKMSVFGLGVGAPVLMIGLFGVALPRGGRWMVGVQWLFGVLIAAFGVSYGAKGLAGYGFDEATTIGVLAGAGLLSVSAYLLQSEQRLPTERTKSALLIVVGATGLFVMGRNLLDTSVAGPGRLHASVLSGSGPLAAATEENGNLTWHLDKDSAYAAAARSGKAVFIDFHGDWCTNCNAFQKRTLSDRTLNQALNEAVLLKVYDTSPLFNQYRDDPRFPELKVGLPFFVITDTRGNVVYKTSDFTKTDEMALFLEG